MEQATLRILRGFGPLDSPNEPEFDAIVQEAALTMGVPIALISLLDENRQWFKAKVGLAAAETPLAISFCTHAVQGAGVSEVVDTASDPRFSTNPLVTGEPHIRFCAGAPLKTASGARIGTLCVIDNAPRARLSHQQRQQLIALADRAVAALDARKRRTAAAGAA